MEVHLVHPGSADVTTLDARIMVLVLIMVSLCGCSCYYAGLHISVLT